jgi:predicted transcriptional regulator
MTRLPPSRRVAAAGPSPATRAGLGPLETRVLEFLWGEGRGVTVRHARIAFPELAYTTLMTTLDRLYRKGWLIRRPRGRAFAYEPRGSRVELFGEMVSGHVTHLLDASGASTAILSTLVRAVGRADAALLDELDALVQAERARLKVADK